MKDKTLTVEHLRQAARMLQAGKPTRYFAIGVPIGDNKIVLAGCVLDIIGEDIDDKGITYYKVKFRGTELKGLPVYASYKLD